MFRLTFLGTSAGLPTKHRNVSGLAVASVLKPSAKNAPWVLVDCGEGTQHQLLKTPLKLASLKAICITHLHGDHCYGLAGLLASLGMHGRTAPLTIIAPKPLIKLLDAFSLVTELYFDYPVEFIAVEEMSEVVLDFGGGHTLGIEYVPLSHRMPSYAYKFYQRHSSERINTAYLTDLGVEKSDWRTYAKSHQPTDPKVMMTHTKQCCLVVAGDNDTPSLLTEAVMGAAALVHECTYTQAVADKIAAKGAYNPMHSSAKDIAVFAQSVGLKNLILTHFSGRFAMFDEPDSPKANMGHIRAEIERYYDGRYVLAEDFLEVLIE
ncbi:MAG: ribonuclease Z [Moraxella sp.]|nr:ribonuclease Z [Moraxella sp.]